MRYFFHIAKSKVNLTQAVKHKVALFNFILFYCTCIQLGITKNIQRRTLVWRMREGEGRAAWKLIGHLTGAVDSGLHQAKR